MKRSLDLIIALGAVIVTLPLLVATAVAILWESGRPVLFVQERVGRYGRIFRMFKFRSMVTNASSVGPHFTVPGDARVTGVGRIIRRLSIDELPQLLNVLRGDMSLIGPRPLLPIQAEQFTEEQWEFRNSVRPGLTGLAQATVRSLGTRAERIALDLQYVREAHGLKGLWLDAKIAGQTLVRLSGKGSN